MNVTITRTALPGRGPRVESFGDVLDVQVQPLDGDKRTQAERNADNAIKAARLARVERHVRELRDALHGIPGSAKVLVEPLLEKLDRALEASVE